MKIGIHGKEFKRQSAQFMIHLLEALTKNNIEIAISDDLAASLKGTAFKKFEFKIFDFDAPKKNYDFFFSVGGDGTLLESITHIGKTEIPVLGINTGRLGFLATVSQNEIHFAIEKLLEGAYQLDQRTLIRLDSDKDLFAGKNFGLNDFTVMKKDTSSMITVHTYIDGEFLNSYWSDGLIISTPTGSTGYSLSCGGPLVFPRSNNFVITPVSPHNLTVRPIVVSDASVITLEIEGRSKKFLVSLDSRFAIVNGTVQLKVLKEKFRINLVQLEGYHYFKTLRQKLNWGLDVRN